MKSAGRIAGYFFYAKLLLFYLQFNPAKSVFLGAYVILISSAISVLVVTMISHFLYYWVSRKKLAALKMKLSSRLKKYDVVVNNEVTEDSDEGLFEAAETRDQVIDTY